MQKVLKQLIPKIVGSTYNVTSHIHPGLAANWAFYSFCRVRNGSIRANQHAFLEKALQQKRSIAGHSIQEYRWEGSGDTVILVHGWESNTARWRNLIRMLQGANFNVVGFDAPGHGKSSGKYLNVPLYADCLDAMIQIHRPKYLVGHSVGGMTIMYNEFKRSSAYVEKIVTTAAPSEFYEIMDEYQNILGLNSRMIQALDELVFNKFGFRIRDFSTSHFAAGNNKKGLLIHDKRDPITPYHASLKVHQAWKNSRLISTEGYGHSLHQEDVNQAIIQFMSDEIPS